MAGPVKEGKGRPTVITPELLHKLEEGASMGMNTAELACYVDVSQRTVYNIFEQDPDFLQRIETLRNKTSMVAKVNVHREVLAGDVDLSQWQLEHRNSGEYTKKQETVSKAETTIKFSDLGDVDKADASKIVGFVLGRIKK